MRRALCVWSVFWALSLGGARVLFAADGLPPTIVQVIPSPGTVTNLRQISLTFSEPVVGLTASDLRLNGVPATMVRGSNAFWFFYFEPLSYQDVQVDWDTDHNIVDLEPVPYRFDETAPGNTWHYHYIDQTPPVLTAIVPAPGATVRDLSQIEVAFNEPVSGVDASDLLIGGIPLGIVEDRGGGRYRFTLPFPVSGPIGLAWATNHGITDLAPVPNAFAGGQWSYLVNLESELPTVRINEFLAANLNGLLDEDGEPQDWIEIYNYGTNTANLTGWTLTDDPDDPGRWTFPPTNLPPGRFLVVSASGKDRRAPGRRLHTNFKLNPNGGYLGLYNAELPPVAVSEFSPQYPPQRGNYSFGYDSTNALKYFRIPTPGGPNGNSAITEIASPPHFNVDRGLFDSPFTLILSHPSPGALIRYTTDGHEPTELYGALYAGPLQITNSTVIRAAAFIQDHLPSETLTHTYLFLDSVIRQPDTPPNVPAGTNVWSGFPSDYEMDPQITTNSAYTGWMKDALKALPSLSLVSSSNDMFGLAPSGPGAGIYTHPLSNGIAWERACSAELLFPDGSPGFQVNCGIQIQGNASRVPLKQPKHSFRLVFKGDFGPARLHYPVFPDSPVQTFDTLVLRGDYNNSWLHSDGIQRARGQRMRDAWFKDTMRAMGDLAGHNRFVHLYLNGLYWGIYDPTERPDGSFAESYLGGDKKEYDVVRPEPLEATDGNLAAYNAMLAIDNLADNGRYELLQQYLDLPQFIDYTLLQFFAANHDWSNTKNWYALRRRVPGSTFKFVPWDGERILEGTNDNIVTQTDLPGGLHPKLVNNPEYRLAFADRVHRHLFNRGALSPGSVQDRWRKRAAELELAIIAESARWGDYRRDVHHYGEFPFELYERDKQYRAEQNRLLTQYFPVRTSLLLESLRAAGLYPDVAAPSFNQHGGRIARGFKLCMTNLAGAGAIYFTTNGTDPRVLYTGAVAPSAQPYSGPVALPFSAQVKARALVDTHWSALNEAVFTMDPLGVPLRITEIMYHPVGGDAYEYVKVRNVGSVTIDIGNFSFEGINFIFPARTLLAPGQTLVLGSSAATLDLWNERYPGTTVFGWFGGSLDDGGERLAIFDAQQNLVCSVDYDDRNGWPPAADGQGAALAIIDPLGDPDAPANWRAEIVPPTTPVRILLNELMALNVTATNLSGTFPDWVELYNPGPQPVDLGGWSLTDDSDPRKFVFPPATILPGEGYLVVWCDSITNLGPGLHTGFALDRNGETITLYSTNLDRMDAVSFGLQLADFSLGRASDSGEWQLTLPTPGEPNQAAQLVPSSGLVINEWLANPLSGAPAWIELHNRFTNAPIALRGIYLGTAQSVFQLNALSFIPAGGFVQLFADNQPGVNHLDFVLAPKGGSIFLYDESGAPIDYVPYPAQQPGVSQGRMPDGSRTFQSFPGSASPGASNYRLAYSGPILNEVLAINDSGIVTAAGMTADWVELYNPGTNACDLTGMRLSTDPAQPHQWVFPAGSSIPAQGYRVVWFDDTQPPSTVAAEQLNTGRRLDGEYAAIYLFNASSQPVDSIEFGFQVPDLSIGRSPWAWSLLAAPTPGASNAPPAALGTPAQLRINEWMANPLEGNDWFELYNPGEQPVRLEGLYLADNPSSAGLTQFKIPPLSFIGARGFVKWIADSVPEAGWNHVNFSLDAEGEAIRLFYPLIGIVDTVYYGWQFAGVSQGRFPDGTNSFLSFPSTASPGAANYLPITNAVINEVLPGADDPFEPAIELHNPSAQAVDITGWFLSRTSRALKQFRIPPGTVLPAGGFAVLYSAQFDPGNFTFDYTRANELFLSAADAAGNLTGERCAATFGPAFPGLSYGRWPTSAGADFAPLLEPTFGVDAPASLSDFRTGSGAWNARPRVGPVVLNEIMYHPAEVDGAEYVELYNASGADVPLFEPALPAETWRLRRGVEFNFPTNLVLPPAGYLLVVDFDPQSAPLQLAAFRNKYLVPPQIPIVGPWTGKLNNAGDSVELYRPLVSSNLGASAVVHLLVDRMTYARVAPWPGGADGDGQSLQRRFPTEYGNEPLNWVADAPTPGQPNPPLPLLAPQIMAQPLSRAVYPTNEVVFGVAAFGTPPLSYQWFYNGIPLPGATNPTWLVPSAQMAGTNDYSVIVSNSTGSVASQPATLMVLPGDADQDGLPDDWELAYGLDPNNPLDAFQDPDGDHMNNLMEYRAGTDPRRADSALKLRISVDSAVVLEFTAQAQKSYILEVNNGITWAGWNWLLYVDPAPTNRAIVVREPAGQTARFYRLSIPN